MKKRARFFRSWHGYFLLGLSIALSAIISLSYRHSYRTHQIHEAQLDLLKSYGELSHATEASTSNARFLILTAEETYAKRYESAQKEFEQTLDYLRAIETREQFLNSLSTIEAYRAELKGIEASAFYAFENGNTKKANELLFSGEYRRLSMLSGRALENAIRTTDDEFRNQPLSLRSVASVSDAQSAKNDILIAIGFALGCVIFAHFVLKHNRSREERREETLKKTRAESAESMERLKLAIDSMGIAVWEFNRSAYTTLWDDRMYELHDHDPSLPPLTHEQWFDRVHPEDRDQMRIKVQEAFKNGYISTRTKMLRQDGTVKHLRLLGRYKDDRILGIAWDITEDVLVHETVEEQRARLASSARLASLGEMAGGVAHEINNPLQIIVGVSSILKHKLIRNEKAVTTDDILKAFDKVEKTADRIARIVKGLRTVARDGDNDPFAPFPAHTIAQDALALCTEKTNRLDVQLITDLESSEQIDLECRSVQIAQILLNLLTNAYYAAQTTKDRWVKLETKLNGDFFEYRVSDSGSGVTPDLRSKIFQPFFTTKDVGVGTGLGLSISLSIARDHGGELYLDETVPYTSFVLRLPVQQAQLDAA